MSTRSRDRSAAPRLAPRRDLVPPASSSPYAIAIGDPARVYAPGDPNLAEAIRDVEFARRAFGVRTAWEDRIARYREIAEVRSRERGAHLEDEVLTP